MNKNLTRFYIIFVFLSILNYFLYTLIKNNYILSILEDKLLLFLIILFIILLILFVLILILREVYQNRALCKKLEKKEKLLKNRNKKIAELRKKIIINRENDRIFFEKSKISSMNELILNITHFWRQPLSIISTLSTSMQIHNELGTISSNDINKNNEMINKNAQYLSSIIEKFTKPSRKRKKELFNIEQLLNDILKHTKSQQIVLQNYLKCSFTIFNHKDELVQVLVNLLQNSFEVFEKRSIDEKYVLLSFNTDEDSLIIKIKDTAGGFEENILSKVFEPYTTTKQKSIGVGLGLFLSYIIVSDILIGKIDVKNEEFSYKNRDYKGASFNIRIPFC